MALSREQLLAAASRPLATREVHVPEWAVDGGDDVVIVRELSAAARDSYQASLTRQVKTPKGTTEYQPAMDNATAKLVAACLVDGDGNLLITKVQDVAALGNVSAVALDRVVDVCREMNGLGEDAEAEAEGESEADPSGATSST